MKLSVVLWSQQRKYTKNMRIQSTVCSYLLFGVLLSCSYNAVSAYKYLAVIHTAAKSHFIVGSSLMKALAQKGHEVYVISPYQQKQPIENYHEIPIPTMLKAMEGKWRSINWQKTNFEMSSKMYQWISEFMWDVR